MPAQCRYLCFFNNIVVNILVSPAVASDLIVTSDNNTVRIRMKLNCLMSIDFHS